MPAKRASNDIGGKKRTAAANKQETLTPGPRTKTHRVEPNPAAVEEDSSTKSRHSDDGDTTASRSGDSGDSFNDFYDNRRKKHYGDGSDSDGYSDDSSPLSNIDVNFDARNMFSRHVDGVSGFIDTWLPASADVVDRHELGIALKSAYCTTLITVTQIEEDDDSNVSVNTADPIDDEDIYGIVSLVHLCALPSRFSTVCEGILTALCAAPKAHVEVAGTSPCRLLKGDNARAMLLLNEHLPVVPPRMLAEVHRSVAVELDALRGQKAPVMAVEYLVVLARVRKVNTMTASPKGKRPHDTSDAVEDIRNLEFARLEDELYFGFRDKRFSVPVLKFPRNAEAPQEHDVARCVIFALPVAKFKEAVESLSIAEPKVQSSS